MKTTLLVSACLLALLGQSVMGQQPDGPDDLKNGAKYKTAYELGRAEADKELKEGSATIFVSGLRRFSENLDRETGLCYRPIAGCIVDDQILGRASGHNARIAEYVKEHGVPSNSFKPWEKELFGLKNYYESRLKSEMPHRLVIGGSTVRSPDSKHAIRPARIQSEKDDGTPVEFLGVVVNVNGVDQEPVMIWHEGETDFLWGPEKSSFAVIRCKEEGKLRYMALDLKEGNWLREE